MPRSQQENPFGITREEVLKLVVDKMVDDVWREAGDTVEIVNRIIREKVDGQIGKNLDAKIDAALTAEMERLMTVEIVPVSIWGERTGSPTTLRDALSERARLFWDVRVDKDGKPTGDYYGKPRHEHLFAKIVNDEFNRVVQQNVTNIIGAFKDAVKADAARITNEHIDKLIAVKTR